MYTYFLLVVRDILMVADANFFTRALSARFTKKRRLIDFMIGCIYKKKVFLAQPYLMFLYILIIQSIPPSQINSYGKTYGFCLSPPYHGAKES